MFVAIEMVESSKRGHLHSILRNQACVYRLSGYTQLVSRCTATLTPQPLRCGLHNDTIYYVAISLCTTAADCQPHIVYGNKDEATKAQQRINKYSTFACMLRESCLRDMVGHAQLALCLHRFPVDGPNEAHIPISLSSLIFDIGREKGLGG